MKLQALGACLLAACCTVPTADDLRIEATVNVWQLQNSITRGRASAVPIAVIEGELYFLTAKHVPESLTPLGDWTAIHRDETELPAGRVVSLHPDEDAAVMAFPLGELPAPFVAKLSFAPLEVGDLVYGSGWGGGYYHWLTQGLVCSEDQTTAQIAPGDSGGGLFNWRGELIAILVGRSGDAHMCWVVPLADIQEWLEPVLREEKAKSLPTAPV